METAIASPYEFHLELRSRPDLSGAPFHHEIISGDLTGLVEETFVRGVLAELFPGDPSFVRCEVKPVWSTEPLVEEIEIGLTAAAGESEARYSQRYSSGRWMRRLIGIVRQLREERTMGEKEPAYPVLFAEKNGTAPSLCPPPLEAPAILPESLAASGVRGLGEGSLVPDRPILFSKRALEEIIEWCAEAGASETGGAMLGKIVRLQEPLPGTTTRIVTVLSACIADRRHEGAPGQVAFDSEALVEASKVAELRGRREEVLSVYHSHGWGKDCERCNENENCPLVECTQVSTLDYQLLESLFPSKAAVMPIAGRKLGSKGRRPVLEIHAWRGGALRPVRWRPYQE